MNTRKIIIILIVVLLVAGIGYGVWSMFLRTPEEVPSSGQTGLPSAATSATSTPSGGYPSRLESTTTSGSKGVLPQPSLPGEEEDNYAQVGTSSEDESKQSDSTKKIAPLSDGEVLGATLTRDGTAVKYYRRKDGHVFRIGYEGGDKRAISSVPIPGLEDVNWAPTKDRVITTRIVDHRLFKIYYDYNTDTHSNIDTRIKKIKWAPNGEKIAYHFIDSHGQDNIAIANPNGSDWHSLEPMSIESTKIYWPNLDFISLVTPGTELYPATVYQLPLGEDKDNDLLEGVSLEAGLKWSLGGNMFIYRKENSEELKIFSLPSSAQENLKIKSSPSKCSWGSEANTIYCAMATEKIVRQGLLPHDYAESLLPQSDSFWQIDLKAREVKELYIPKSKENVVNVKKDSLMVSPDEKYLLWVDSGDGKLYRLKI